MRIAVISDIHGNLAALKAVGADFVALGVDAVVNLGDLLSGPMDPAGVADWLRDFDYPTVRGNHDRHLYDRPPEKQGAIDRHVAAQLSAETRDWLRALPETLVVADEIFLCHGTPTSDTLPFVDNWWEGRTSTMPDEAEVTRRAAGVDLPVLLCGHTHLPRVVRLRDGRMIVNPGSVGIQFNHGAPDARYALLEKRQGRWQASLRAVPYEHEIAALQAIAAGFPNWADALRSGWASPRDLF